MFADPFLIPRDYAAASDMTVSCPATNVSGTNVSRIITGAADGYPKGVRFSHSVVGKGSVARDRHLVQFTAYATVGGVEDKSKPIVLYAVLDVPQSVRGTSTTVQTIRTLNDHLTGFLRGRGPGATGVNPNHQYLDRWSAGES